MKLKSKFFAVSCLALLVLAAPSVYSQSTEDKRPRSVKYISGASPKAEEGNNSVKKRSISLEKSTLDPAADYMQLEMETFDLINLKRLERGLPELMWNQKVADIARKHSRNMATYGFFSHIGANGRLVDKRAAESGLIDWSAIGENIAFNKGYKNPTSLAVEKWMLSEGHKTNLLNSRWSESGLGIAVTVDGKYFFTQIFITR